jgi:hypothetical protein
MKRGGCFAFGCAGTLGLAALAGIVVWGSLAPEGAPVRDPASKPTFNKVAAGDRLRLSFGFADHDDNPHQVTCTLSRQDYEREVAGFGYSEKERRETLNRELLAMLEGEAAARGLERYFKIEVYGDQSYRWSYQLPASASSRLEKKAEDLHGWLETSATEAFAPTAERYYREHGFRLQRETLGIDYERAVLQAGRPLADCFEALRRAGGEVSAARQLGLFLAFFQDLRYELPPEVDAQGRNTLGFRGPTAVMAEGAGDCDSKAAAFCTLWRRLRTGRVILILVPEHALVGVEGKPGIDQGYVRLGNRYYILCEVAGPARTHAGATSISGSFEYVLIEPGE